MWHPADLPQGYHTTTQGQSHTAHAPVPSGLPPGPPRGPGSARPTGCHNSPARKIIGNPRTLFGLVEKHLIQNQMLGGRHTPAGVHARGAPDLHQLVHQRLRMTMDAGGREPEDEAPPRTNCSSRGVLLPTTDHMAYPRLPGPRCCAGVLEKEMQCATVVWYETGGDAVHHDGSIL